MFYASYILWFGVIVILIYSSLAKSSFKFTNLKCEDHDVSFSRFETCKLSVIGRGVVALDLRIGLYKTPVTNATVNIAISKRGYRPSLYNVTNDVCGYFANRKRYPMLHLLFSLFQSHSNMNHTCPYYDDIIIKDYVVEESMFRFIPLPEGDYTFKTLIYAYNDLKETVQVSFSRKDALTV